MNNRVYLLEDDDSICETNAYRSWVKSVQG